MTDWTECPICRKPLYGSDHDLGCPEELDMADEYQPLFEEEYDEFFDPLDAEDDELEDVLTEEDEDELDHKETCSQAVLCAVDDFLRFGTFKDLIRLIVENT